MRRHIPDQCKVTIVPHDELGLKLILKGCTNELEEIRRKTAPYTMRWLEERIETHEWTNDEAE